jgi:hypothetical protein
MARRIKSALKTPQTLLPLASEKLASNFKLRLSKNEPSSDHNSGHAVVFRELSNTALPTNKTIYYNNTINVLIYSYFP